MIASFLQAVGAFQVFAVLGAGDKVAFTHAQENTLPGEHPTVKGIFQYLSDLDLADDQGVAITLVVRVFVDDVEFLTDLQTAAILDLHRDLIETGIKARISALGVP